MTYSANPFNVAYLPYMGQSAPNPRNTFYRRRAPTNSDRRLYTVGDRWIDTASQIAYILVGKTATTATWVQISGAGGVTALNGLTGALTLINQGGVGAVTWTVPGSGGPNTIGLSVNVDGVTIQIVGNQLVAVATAVNITPDTGVNVTNDTFSLLGTFVAAGGVPVQTNGTAANSMQIEVQLASQQLASSSANAGLASFDSTHFTVDANGFVQLAGGSVALDSVQVDAITAPGVNPVVPDGAGLMTVGGTFVAAFGTPVRSHSSAVNAYDIEVQLASQQLASSSANAGLASFNNLHFTVDGNGWVSNLNGLPISSVDVDGATAPGTDPVLPTALGVMGVGGAQVAAGTVPSAIRTQSIAANSYQIQIQRSSAQAISSVTQNGVSHFDSAHFTVDANGFVQLIQAPFTWQDFAGGALAVSNGYFATAAAVYTLPAGTTDGETVEIIDNIGGGVVVTAQGGNTIRIQNTASSANGTATSSQFGDALRLIYRASISEWQCCPGGGGMWTLA